MTEVTSIKSYVLVSVQFVCLGIIVLTGPLFVSDPWFLGLELAGIGIGVWALQAMRIKNLRAYPEVREGSELVTRGPYQFIRHPMYTALLLFTLALVLGEFSYVRLVVWVVLGMDLIVKLTYEEQLLNEHFKEYAAYQRKTSRLVPLIF